MVQYSVMCWEVLRYTYIICVKEEKRAFCSASPDRVEDLDFRSVAWTPFPRRGSLSPSLGVYLEKGTEGLLFFLTVQIYLLERETKYF